MIKDCILVVLAAILLSLWSPMIGKSNLNGYQGALIVTLMSVIAPFIATGLMFGFKDWGSPNWWWAFGAGAALGLGIVCLVSIGYGKTDTERVGILGTMLLLQIIGGILFKSFMAGNLSFRQTVAIAMAAAVIYLKE